MPDTGEIVLSDLVLEYLGPVSGGSETGADASNTEEYFKLNMEIQKTVPDYKLCIEFCNTILKEKSKDLKVAVWLSFALFRTEKIRGLRDGLLILLEYLKRYGNKLYPSNEAHRSKALQFLNSSRYFKLVEKEEVNKNNFSEVLEANKILQDILAECEKQFPASMPVLNDMIKTLKDQAENAEGIKNLKTVSSLPPAQTQTVRKEERPAAPPSQSSTVEPRKPAAGSSEDIKVSSEKDALLQMKKLINFFFEETSDGVKREKLPDAHIIFGLSRQLLWGRIIRPQETDKITQIEPPNQVIQGKIKEWFSGEAWDKLIPRIELGFTKADSEFLYWLDAQRFVVKALEKAGGNYSFAADDIKYQLSKLINRIPDLPSLKFKDKTTPFADSDTIKWLNAEVLIAQTGGAPRPDTILPPIMGEEYKSISEEYDAACTGLPKKFEENLASLQEGIQTDTRRKGKFLRRLNVANFCFSAKEYNLAKVHLSELSKEIGELNLADWEPALCTAVWQSEYLTNSKIMSDVPKDQVHLIEKDQKELFSKIAKQNGILALKLTKKK